MKPSLPSPSTLLAFTLGALLFGSHFGFGFTEPSSIPPFDNVPAPLNVGATGQSKAGGLILNTGGAANGLIVQSGNVGIGTANPGANLDVSGSNPAIAIRDNRVAAVGNGGVLNLQALDNADATKTLARISAYSLNNLGSAGHMLFSTMASNVLTERMRIQSDGNVGIGTNSPGVKLEVSGAVKIGSASVTCNSSAEGVIRWDAASRSLQACASTGWYGLTPSPYTSCKALKDLLGYAADGIYTIYVGTTHIDSLDVYCIMNPAVDGGGWTMVLASNTTMGGWPGGGSFPTIPATVNTDAVRYNMNAKMQTPYIDSIITEATLITVGTKWTKFYNRGANKWADFMTQQTTANWKDQSGNMGVNDTYNDYNGFVPYYFYTGGGSQAYLLYAGGYYGGSVCNGGWGGNGNPAACAVFVR